MENKLLLIPAILEGYRSLKDRTLKITFETSEPTPDQIKQIHLSMQKYGFLAFSSNESDNELKKAMDSLPKIEFDGEKSKSQRFRAVLFRNWEQNKNGYEVFDDYYNFHYEKIINHYKDKLD